MTQPLFSASFARARMRGWCRSCHEPRGSAPAGEGIGCTTCHLPTGQNELVTSHEVTEAARAAHPIRTDPSFGTAKACEGCHQFSQPILDTFPIENTEVWAQDTVHEWEASGVKASCQACHFKTHEATGAHDLNRLAGAIEVHADKRVATLSLKKVGHRVPTGDPFRRLVFEACSEEACVKTLKRWAFQRIFTIEGKRVIEKSDSRLIPGQVRTLELPKGTTHWRLRVVFAESGLEGLVDAAELGAVVMSGQIGGP